MGRRGAVATDARGGMVHVKRDGALERGWAPGAGRKSMAEQSGGGIRYIEVEDGFTIVKMRPPKEMQGFTLGQSKVNRKYGVTVIGVKPPGLPFVYATDETRIASDDIIVVTGQTSLLERFAARP